MLRVEVPDEDWRYYLLGYLKSTVGQNLLKWGETGSVIDHMSPDHLAGQDIPILENSIRVKIIELVRDSFILKEQARTTMNDVLFNYEKKLPSINRNTALKSGWTYWANNISDRFGFHFHKIVFNHSLIPSVNTHYFQIMGQSGSYNGSYCRIHSGGISAGGKNCYFFYFCHHLITCHNK